LVAKRYERKIMPRQNISSGSKFEPTIGFSRAVRVGNFIAVAGTAPIGLDGKVAGPGDLYVQTQRCIQIAGGALEKAGGSLRDVVRTRLFLTNIKDWEKAAKAHGEAFGDIRPACTFVQVAGLIDPAWLLEMEFDAVVA
jgi:enamine deaminase RidA (YjgF/YER057c/UK114 family)